MSNWRFSGIPLFGAGSLYLKTDFDDADELPPLRGDNPNIPMREGRIDVAQMYDQRKISMGIYVTANSISAYESSMDALRQVMGVGKSGLLEHIMEDGSIRQAAAKVLAIAAKRVTPNASKLTVDFLLASPFFRGQTKYSQTISVAASPTTASLTNPGTATDRSAVITLTGPLSYPKLTNLITDLIYGTAQNVWMAYNAVIQSGEVIIVDVGAGTCLSGSTNKLANLIHSGDAYHMLFLAGTNSLKIEASGTGGSIKIEFYPPYF